MKRVALLAAAILIAAGLGAAYSAGAFGGDSPARTVERLGELVDVDTNEADTLGAGTAPTSGVPCANRHHHLVGPRGVRRFHAVTAVSCIEETRTYPGQGQWWVRIRRVAVGSVAGLQRYFDQLSEHRQSRGVLCDDVGRVTLVPTLVDADGDWLVPQVPVDSCGDPLAGGTPSVPWHVASVRKVKLMISPAALAAHCSMEIKDLPAGGIGPLSSTSGGPLFKSTPQTVRVCIYRTEDFEVGNFVRGLALSVAQTQRLLGAMTRAAPSGGCPNERTFAVISAKPELWAEVELGGCWRVGRTYPDYGMGGSDAAVVRAILGTR